MGFSVIYSAIPPSSNLYLRLQSEKALNLLVDFVFTDGCGIYRFFEIDPEEIDNIFENVVKTYPKIFKSQLELERVIADLRSLLTLTRQTFPGIEDRTAMLEKSSEEIEQLLVQELSRRQVANAQEIVQKLLEGDRILPQILYYQGNMSH